MTRGSAAFLTAGLILIATITYWPGLYGWFIFDDHVNLVTAEGWKVTSLHWQHWLQALTSDISGKVGRPLAMGSFAANHYFTGLDPFWLKAGNLALHLTNGLLIWCLCHQSFQLLPENQRPANYISWIIAVAWTVHPLQVSTVMYIVQRMEIGAATGILLSLTFYMKGRVRQIEGRTGWPWLASLPLPVLLGLGFKETALLVPAFALLLEYTLLRFRSADTAVSRRWKVTWAALILSGACLYIYMIVPQVAHWPYEIRGFGPTERLLTQLPVLVMYVQQTLLPLPETMRFYYDSFPISHSLFRPLWTATSAVALAALVATSIFVRNRFILTTLGVVWFFTAHALTSNLWPLEIAFEHRNYLALLGLLLAVVQPLGNLASRLSNDAKLTILILPILLLAALCNLQARTWGDPTQLAWTLENRAPNSPRASYDLASQLLIAAGDDPSSPFWSMAIKQFERDAFPPTQSPLAIQGLLLTHGRAGIDPPPEYWELLQNSLLGGSLYGGSAASLQALTACQIQGRCNFDTSRMTEIFIDVVRQHHNNATAHTLYANFAWNVLDERPLAIKLQAEAARLAPTDPAHRIALAKFLLASHESADVDKGRELIRHLKSENRFGSLSRDIADLERLARAAQPPPFTGP